jgi:hypothetical protein
MARKYHFFGNIFFKGLIFYGVFFKKTCLQRGGGFARLRHLTHFPTSNQRQNVKCNGGQWVNKIGKFLFQKKMFLCIIKK